MLSHSVLIYQGKPTELIIKPKSVKQLNINWIYFSCNITTSSKKSR